MVSATLKSGSSWCYFGEFKPDSCCHHLNVLGFVAVSLFYYSEENKSISVLFLAEERLCEHWVDGLQVAQWLNARVPSSCYSQVQCHRDFPPAAQGFYGLSGCIPTLSTWAPVLQPNPAKWIAQPGCDAGARGRVHTSGRPRAHPSWPWSTPSLPSQGSAAWDLDFTKKTPILVILPRLKSSVRVILCMCTVLVSLSPASTGTGHCCSVCTDVLGVNRHQQQMWLSQAQATNKPGFNKLFLGSPGNSPTGSQADPLPPDRFLLRVY